MVTWTSLNTQIGICVPDVLQQGIVLLADPGLAVMASDIVPMDSVVVEVIEHCQTSFFHSSLLHFTVIGLRLANASVLGPIVLLAIGSGCQLLQLRRPEPSVDVGRLQVWAFASTEVALSTAGPNVLHLREWV